MLQGSSGAERSESTWSTFLLQRKTYKFVGFKDKNEFNLESVKVRQNPKQGVLLSC